MYSFSKIDTQGYSTSVNDYLEFEHEFENKKKQHTHYLFLFTINILSPFVFNISEML